MKIGVLIGLFLAVASALAGIARASGAQGGLECHARCLGMDGARVFPGKASRATGIVAFPHHAQQGRGRWYLVRLEVNVALTDHGIGTSFITFDTNHRTAAQIEIERRAAQHGEATVSTVGLIDGYQSFTTDRSQLKLTFTNFLQNGGVKDGRVPVTVGVESIGEPVVTMATVLPATAIFSSRRGPGHLHMRVALPAVAVHPGDKFEIPIRLTNNGGRTVRQIAIRSSTEHGLVRLVDNTLRGRSTLSPGRAAAGVLTYRAFGAGVEQIALDVRSSTNRPNALLAVRIDHVSRVSHRSYILGLSGVVALVIAAAVARGKRGSSE